MPVLVTGGAGYIGSHMVHELLDAGEAVVVLDNLTTGRRAAVPEDRVHFHIGDIADETLVANLIQAHGINTVIHFAGSVVVPDSVRDPLGYYHNNTVKTRSLLAATVASGVKQFIFSSTAAVYGMPAVTRINEDVPCAPISPYGTSKWMSEMMLRDTAAAHDLRYVALRYFNVAGADPAGRTGQSTPNATHLIKVACQTALGARPHLDIFGTDYATADGTCVRDYIHVTDLARAHSAALGYLRDGGHSTVLNCGYGKGASVRDVIGAVKRTSGADFNVRLRDRRAGDPAELTADATRIRDVLGWQPRYAALDTIVADAFRWEQNLADFDRAEPRQLRRTARSATNGTVTPADRLSA